MASAAPAFLCPPLFLLSQSFHPGLTGIALDAFGSQPGCLGSAGSRSVEGSGRSDSIPKSGKGELQDRNPLGGFSLYWVSLQLQPHCSTLTLTSGSTRSENIPSSPLGSQEKGGWRGKGIIRFVDQLCFC